MRTFACPPATAYAAPIMETGNPTETHLAASPATRRAARVHYGLVVLGLVVLAVFGSLGLARFGYTSILPAMQDALKLSNTQTGELQSWNLLGYLLTVVG